MNHRFFPSSRFPCSLNVSVLVWEFRYTVSFFPEEDVSVLTPTALMWSLEVKDHVCLHGPYLSIYLPIFPPLTTTALQGNGALEEEL